MSVSVLYTFLFRFLDVKCNIDELCMSAYVNVRRFHWILLRIQPDKSEVEVMDSLNRDQEQWSDMKAMLQK